MQECFLLIWTSLHNFNLHPHSTFQLKCMVCNILHEFFNSFYTLERVRRHYSNKKLNKHYSDETLRQHYSNEKLNEHYSNEKLNEHYSNETLRQHYSNETLRQHYFNKKLNTKNNLWSTQRITTIPKDKCKNY